MTTFNLVLDTNAAMLLQLAGYGVDRATAFKVLDRVNSMDEVIVTPTIDALPPVRVSIYDGCSPIVTIQNSEDPDTEACWIRLGDVDVYAECHAEAIGLLHDYDEYCDDYEWGDDRLVEPEPANDEHADYDIYGVHKYWNY